MLPWRKQSKVPLGGQGQGANEIKRKLLSALQEAISELQYDRRADNATPIPSNELSGRLLMVLEATFVHGLKETFLGRLSSRLQESSSPRMPEPSFWTFCLVFSHKQVISQVESLSQVSTEVGRARAWLRLALNDGLLGSYLAAMAKDQVSLSVHYDKFAFLRDCDMRDLLLNYLAGVEVYTFGLSTNVSLLNRWQAGPLILAGLWAPNLNDSIVEGAQDVVAGLAEDLEEPPAFTRTLAEPIRGSTSYVRRGLLNEDEALRLILASTPISFSPDFSADNQTKQKEEDDDKASLDSPYQNSPSPSPEPMLPRSSTVSPTLHWDHTNSYLIAAQDSLSPDSLAEELSRAEIYNSNENDTEDNINENQCIEVEETEKVEDIGESDDVKEEANLEIGVEDVRDTNNDLVEEVTLEVKHVGSSVYSSTSSLASCQCSSAGPDPACPHCSSAQPRPQLVATMSPPPGHNDSGDLICLQNRREKRLGQLCLGFAQPPSIRVPSLSLTQNISLIAALDVITHEVGLDSQDWRCHDCSAAIGAIFGPWYVCHLTSRYYCSDCHVGQTAVIPARLLYNWDATPRPVSKSSAIFLTYISTKPILDITAFNPSLMSVVPAVEEATRLRKKLTYLVAYLSACSRAQQEGVKVALAEVVWPREYLYTGVDTYSLKDIEQLHKGELKATLHQGVKVCTNHVLSCLVCSGRGFICELCGDKRPVYPFHLETTSQCQECQTVFHLACARGLVSCPKCERMAARSLNWHVTNSKLARETGEEVV